MANGIWRPALPASETALAKLRAGASFRLPDAYLEQLATSNGGEGDLAVEPRWIVFWPADDVLSLNAQYSVPELLPGFFGFGTNGGGELLAFDLRGPEPHPIAMVPFIPLDAEHAVQIAASFNDLRRLVGTKT